MGESGGIDSSGGRTMPKAYSADIRMRVIARVEGGASRREAAEQLDISPSAAVKWVKCFHETGSCASKPRGGSTSRLEAHAPWLLTLIEGQPDLTLDGGLCDAQARHRGQSHCPVDLLQAPQHQLQKKACAPRSRIAQTWPGHVDAGSDGKPCLIPPDWCSSTRPRPIRKWSG